MIKKSGAKKPYVKAPKKPLKKKAAAIHASPEKPAAKKTAVTAKLKKKPAVKKTGRVQTQKKKVQKPKKTALKQKPVSTKAVPKKTIKKTPATPYRKTSKKVELPSKAEKPPKTIKVKSTAKGGRAVKAQETKKTTTKVTKQPIKKVATKKIVKAEVSKPRKSPPQKVFATRAKKKVTGKVSEPEKTEQPKAVRKKLPGKMPAVPKSEEIVQVKKTGLPKETKKEGKKVTATQELQEIKTDTIPTDDHSAEITFPPSPIETLPSEYGENCITLMTVNPYKIFSFWEVREETLKTFRGILNLRVYDVTGIDFDAADAVSFFDVAVSKRVGEMYLDVSPVKEYVADIGIVFNGIFIGIARSPKISTPSAGVPGEEEFLPEGMDISIRIGY